MFYKSIGTIGTNTELLVFYYTAIFTQPDADYATLAQQALQAMNDQQYDILLQALKQGHTQRFITSTTKWVGEYYERSLNFLQEYFKKMK